MNSKPDYIVNISKKCNQTSKTTCSDIYRPIQTDLTSYQSKSLPKPLSSSSGCLSKPSKEKHSVSSCSIKLNSNEYLDSKQEEDGKKAVIQNLISSFATNHIKSNNDKKSSYSNNSRLINSSKLVLNETASLEFDSLCPLLNQTSASKVVLNTVPYQVPHQILHQVPQQVSHQIQTNKQIEFNSNNNNLNCEPSLYIRYSSPEPEYDPIYFDSNSYLNNYVNFLTAKQQQQVNHASSIKNQLLINLKSNQNLDLIDLNQNHIPTNQLNNLNKINHNLELNSFSKNCFPNQLNLFDLNQIQKLSNSFQVNNLPKRLNSFNLIQNLFNFQEIFNMSNNQLQAMDQLLNNNPRTCSIQIDNNFKNLGFNLNTKKKKFYAHSIVKLDPNLAAAKAGIQENDLLLMINNQDCRKLKHYQVVDLLKKKTNLLQLFVCQPSVYELYLTRENESKLIQEEEDTLSKINKDQLSSYHKYQQPSYEKYDFSAPNLNCNELYSDEPIQFLHSNQNSSLPYIDHEEIFNETKDNQINKKNQPILQTNLTIPDIHNQSTFKRNYKLKQSSPLPKKSVKNNNLYSNQLEDEDLSLTNTVASNFDEHYNELRDEIFNQSLNKMLSKKDKYNFESQDIEFNEYIDMNSHKLEKCETKVEITNNEYQNKKITTKLVEKIFKSFDEVPMKNIFSSNSSTNQNKKSFNDQTDLHLNNQTTTKTDNKQATNLKNIKIQNENKSTSKNETTKNKPKSTNLFDLNYPLSQNTNLFKSSYACNVDNFNKKSYNKEPLIERKNIQPNQAQLVQILNDEEIPENINQPLTNNQTKPLVTSNKPISISEPILQDQNNENKPTNQNELPNYLPSPRLCTLILPKHGNVSYGFTIKTNRKTNEKNIIEIVPKSIAHRAGLRLDDIIIEVNGINVTQDSHKQTTDRIKNSKNEICLLVVSEQEMNVYKKFQLIPTSKQSNVIEVEFDHRLVNSVDDNQANEEDCVKGCANFLSNLSARQYRSYLLSHKPKPEHKKNSVEFEKKIKKFEKM